MFFATKTLRHEEEFTLGLVSLKGLILAFLLLIYSLASVAQISFGVKGGINFSNVAYVGAPSFVSSSFTDTENLTGIHFGVYGKLKLNRNLSIIQELQFAQRGFKGFTGFSKEVREINYFELPLLLSYSVHKLISLDLGASPSFLVSSPSPFFLGVFKNFDINAIVGIRFDLVKNFFLTGRFYYGLISISDTEFRLVNGSVSTITTFNRAFQLSIGYKIK